MDLQFAGRSVLVTGASSGVGLATTRLLLSEGARVLAVARDGERLARTMDETCAELGLPGPGAGGPGVEAAGVEGAVVVAHAADVTDRSGVEAAVARAVECFGGLDSVVCNAGRSLMATLSETSDEQIREELELKVFGAWNVIRAARAHLRASGTGSVVNTNAILAKQPETRLAITSAARAALLNLSRTMAAELGGEGIRVNSVNLGLIDTGQWRRRYEEYVRGGGAESYESWSADIAADRGISLGRFGRAEEAAYAIVSLLSPRASYITGAHLDVGGGVTRQP